LSGLSPIKLLPNTRVTLIDLKKSVAMNGLLGAVVKRFDDMRYSIRLDSGRFVNVLDANVAFTSAPPPDKVPSKKKYGQTAAKSVAKKAKTENARPADVEEGKDVSAAEPPAEKAKPKGKAQPKAKGKVQPKAKGKVQPKAKGKAPAAKPKAEAKCKGKAKAPLQPAPEPKAKAKAKAKTPAQPAPDTSAVDDPCGDETTFELKDVMANIPYMPHQYMKWKALFVDRCTNKIDDKEPGALKAGFMHMGVTVSGACHLYM
jgi:hypothetical protein